MRHLFPIALVGLLAAALALTLCTGPADTPASPAPMAASPPIAAAPAKGPEDDPRRDVAQPTAARDATATAGASLFGRVLLDSRPLARCTVAVIEHYGWQGECVLGNATSDENGAFAVSSLPAGSFSVLLRGDAVPLELPPWSVQLAPAQCFDFGELRIPAAVTLQGRVVDAAGRPMAGVTVYRARMHGTFRFRRDLAAGDPEADPHAVTGDDGTFEFANLAPVPVQLLVDQPGWLEVAASAELSAGQRTQVPDFTLRPGRQLRGHVLDQAGAPIAGATITPESGAGERNPRRAVTSVTDGSFAIDGVSVISKLFVTAAGFAELEAQVGDPAQPAVFALSRLTGLRGRVTGLGSAPAHVVVEPELDAGSRMPPISAYEWLHKPLPVRPDGTFAIDGLPDASYVVTAFAPAVGESAAMKVALPCGPVELAIVPGVRVRVTVRDDTGRPLPAAEVCVDPDIREYPELFRSTDPRLVRDRIDRKAGKLAATTDDSGLATIVAARGQPLAVVVYCPGHMPASAMFFDSLPEAVDLVLPRAGRIQGLVDDPSGLAQHSMWVAAWPQGGDPRHEERSCAIDARGAFRSRDLLPGPWWVALRRLDRTYEDPSRQLPQPVPLLGSAIDERTRTLVVVPPAGEVEVALRSLPLARIDGRVLANGAPIGGIVVFGMSRSTTEPGDDDGFNPAGLDAPNAHDFKPHATTAADGTFTMHVASTGTYELRARHPRQAVASPPTLVTVTTLGERMAVDLQLPAGGLRGRWPAGGGNAVSAFLYPAAAAARDPFSFGDLSRSDVDDRLGIRLDADGAFAFECVPPGDYVLRLIDRLPFEQAIVWQGGVTVGPTTLDLGELARPARVAASATVFAAADADLGAWIRQELPGVPDGAFVCAALVAGGRLELARLPPGRYRVQFFTPFVFAGQWGLQGTSRGAPIAIDLRADGTTEPRVLTPP